MFTPYNNNGSDLISRSSPMERIRASRFRLSAAVAAVAVSSLVLAGCSSTSGGTENTSSTSLVPQSDQGVLKEQVPSDFKSGIKVATQADIAPLTFTTDSGEITGFDQDLMKAMSEVLGVPIKVEPVTFENLILGVESGTYDFVADTTIKKERLKKYDMLSYLTSSYSVATLASADALPTEETALCGFPLGIVIGEISGEYVRNVIDPQCAAKGLPAVATTEYKDFAGMILAVRGGNVKGLIADTMTFGYFQKKGDGSDFKFNGPARLDESMSGYSFMKTQGGKLAPVVQKALEKLIEDGAYAKIQDKYGLGQSGVKAPALNPETKL